MKNNLTVGSLFAGIGGICIAFKKAGCNVLWANEYNKHACDTYRTNLSDTQLIEKDIHKLNTKDVQKVDIITSGFPCQAFSIAGYRQGFNDKKGRGNLFFETVRFIDELKPKAFLLENVKNLANHDGGKTLKVIRDTILNDLKYSFIPFVLNAKDFGNIPQNRERIYIVGFKGEAKYTSENRKATSLGKYICTHHFMIPSKITLKKTIHDMLSAVKQDSRFYYKNDHPYYQTLISEMKRKDTIYQWRRVYVRENKNNVCPTLTANMGTGGHNVPLITDDYGIRKLTPEECLSFQGFPKNFKFPQNMALSHRYKQAGNSVVVPVVERIAKNIVKTIIK